MKKTEFTEDLSTILFLLPFIASGVYGIYLWVARGISISLPSDVYLSVTRDPYIFLLGFAGVVGALLIQVNTADPEGRLSRVSSLSGTLQKIAAASFILALLMAVYANGTNLSGAALDFIVGRFSLVFPALVVLLSYLIVTPMAAKSLASPKLWGIVALIASPPVLYEVGKRNSILGLVLALALIVVGVLLYSYTPKAKVVAAPA